MFTFIELQGFSKQRQALLPDDEFLLFQEALIDNPEIGDTIADTGGFRKNTLATFRHGEKGWSKSDLL